MTIYTERLWGSTSSGYPSSILTKRWVTTNETSVQTVSDLTADGDYLFEQEWSASAQRLNSLNAIDSDANRDDIELLCRFRLEGTSRIDYEFGLVGRASGSAGSETAYQCYLLESTTTPNSLRLRFVRMDSGTSTTLETSSDLIDDVGTDWLWLRFRINGSDLKAKIWYDGYSEPSAWQHETTDSNLTGVGWGGLWGWQSNRRADVDYLSIGTNGDTGEILPGLNTGIRVTSAGKSALYDGTATTRLTTINKSTLYDGNPNLYLTTISKSVLYDGIPLIQTGIQGSYYRVRTWVP